MQKQKQIRFSQILQEIPFANRTIFIIVCLTWIFDLFGNISKTLLNDSSYSWSPNYQIWRIFTASFCSNSLFLILLACLNMYTFLPKLQQKASSINILANFFISGLILQFFYTLIAWCFPFDMMKFIGMGDLCGIWFNLIFKYCYSNPNNKIKICCFPRKINLNMYPFAILLFIMLLTFQLKIDCIVGMFLGLIQCIFFKGFLISFKSDLFCNVFSRFRCWVPALQNSQNSNPFIGLAEEVVAPNWSRANKLSEQNYFKNKKGVVIG